jgi:acetoacetate decarboxylase
MLYALDRSQVRQLRGQDWVWEFRGAEMLWAMFRTDRQVVERILPKPLKCPPEPLATAFVGWYPSTNFGLSYREGGLFLGASYKGEEGVYCLAMPVDDAMAMAGGREQFGFPKKVADAITLDRQNDLVVGRVVRRSCEILRLECELAEPTTEHVLEFLGPVAADLDGRPCRKGVTFLFKYFFSPSGRGLDYVPRLVRQVTLLRPRADTRTGKGTVSLASTAADPLGEVPVREVLAFTYGLWDNDMLPGRVVGRAWNVPGFLPHAMFKLDFFPHALTSDVLARQDRRQRTARWKAIRRY